MTACKNTVPQLIKAHGGCGYKRTEYLCGSIGIHGTRLICDNCQKEFDKQYPQGWRHTPGDICEHGTYIGDPYGSDILCAQCEGEVSTTQV